MSIVLRSLTAAYPGGEAVIDGLDLDVATDEWLAVIGPNGAGKSTLLRAIAGLVGEPGATTLDGSELASMTRRQVAQRVALVPQDPLMPPGMTVAEYVLLGRTPHLPYLGTESRHDVDLMRCSIDQMDLAGFEERPVDGLSGGERQRVVLARALAQESSILLLDEPTSALDIGHRQQAMRLIGDLRDRRAMTIVAAMHDLTLAGQFADRLALISGGRIVEQGPPGAVLTEEIIARHYDAAVRVLTLDDGTVAVVPVAEALNRRTLGT